MKMRKIHTNMINATELKISMELCNQNVYVRHKANYQAMPTGEVMVGIHTINNAAFLTPSTGLKK